MDVEVWSDVACPWCYIGKRRLAAALEGFEHADRVRVVWRSFELDPDGAPDEGPVVDHLAVRKGMTPDQVRALTRHVAAVAAEEGLAMDFDRTRAGSTFLAHQLLHFADASGLRAEAAERLFRALFAEGLALGEVDVLARLAGEVGLDPGAAAAALREGAHAEAVRADEREAAALGVTGVPFFVVDRRYGLSGAQPAETLRAALERAWRERAVTQAG